MPSLVPGYEYDIFISYRQKDNKHDGWVTEFVNNLKGELESTFKEEVSVYFDINPHDGLLETHDVDESLKDKLKCLVFVPIISRTYCDPNSFAWVHEFKAFIEQASKDQFGLKVKLTGGNVANRVLPVQIHELDEEDGKLVESELGGHLRGVEFIYKEPGVNRPLTPKDTEGKNINKTNYTNQINKVANAVKEIITALKKQSQHPEEAAKEDIKVKSGSKKRFKTKIIIGSIIALVLIILGILFIPKLFKQSEELEKSIAVLPFKNDSPDQERMYFINGTMEAILDNLCKIKDLRVPGRTSVEQYRDNLKPIPTIAKELDVDYILEGSGHRDGNKVRLYVQLLDARKDKHLWSKTYDTDIEEIFTMQSEIAQLVAEEIEAVITPEEKVLIDKIPTTNLTAYDFYQRGKEEYMNYYFDGTNRDALRRTIDLYKKALEYDSTFALAYSGLAVTSLYAGTINDYLSQNYLDSVPILVEKALSYDNSIAEAYYARALYYYFTGKSEQAKEEFDKAIKYNPNYWEAYADKASLIYINDYNNADFVKAIEYYSKAISLNQGKERPDLLRRLGGAYGSNAGFFDKAVYCYQEALKLDNDSLLYFRRLADMEFNAANFTKAAEYYNRILLIDSADIINQGDLGSIYMQLGQYKKSLKHFEKYFEWVKASGTITEVLYHRIGFVYWKTGDKNKAKYYLEEGKRMGEESIKLNRFYATSLGAYYDLAGIYAFMGEKDKAYKNLEEFKQIKVIPSWWMTLVKNDQLFDNIKDEPQFREIVKNLESKYQAEHERVRKWLEEQGML